MPSTPRRSAGASRWAARGAPALVYGLPLALFGVLAALALTKPMWRDEWATWQFSGLDLDQLWAATSHVDRGLWPYYVLIHVLRGLGAGITVVRTLSLLGAAAALTCTQAVAQRLWGRRAALAAGLALATHPAFLLQATWARPAGLAFMVVGVSTLLAVRGTRASALAWPWVLALGALLQPSTLLAVPAQVAWQWRANGARTAARWALGAVPAAVVVTIWSLSAWDQRGQVQASLASVGALRANTRNALGVDLPLVGLHVVVLASILCMTLFSDRAATARARAGVWLALLLGEGTIALAWLATACGVPLLHWHLLVAAPLGTSLLLGAALGVPWLAHRDLDLDRGLRIFLAALSVAAMTLGVRSWVNLTRDGLPIGQITAVASAVAGVARPGDLLIVQQPYGASGYTAGFADATGDRDLTDAVLRSLPSGAPAMLVRTVTHVDAGSHRVLTRAADASGAPQRTWVVRLASQTLDTRTARSLGCPSVQVSELRVADSIISLLTCVSAASA